MRKKIYGKRTVAIVMATAMTFSVANVPIIDGWRPPMAQVLAAPAENAVNVTFKGLEFDETNEWDDKGDMELTAVLPEGGTAMAGMKLIFDVLLPVTGEEQTAAFSGQLKVQSVFKIGDEWTWTDISTNDTAADDYEKVTIGEQDYFLCKVEVPLTEDYVDVKSTHVKIAGWKCDYQGDVLIANAAFVGEEDNTDYDSLEPVWTNCAFDPGNSWDQHKTDENNTEYQQIVDFDAVPNQGAVMSADILVKGAEIPNYMGKIQFKAVMRLGENWHYVASQSYPYVEAKDLEPVAEDSQWYKATVTWEFGATVDAWYDTFQGETDFKDAVTEKLSALSVECAGCNSDFTGDIYITNVKFKDGEKELEKADPTVVADFAEGIDGWAGEAGYDYSHGKADSDKKEETAEAAWDEESKSLKMTVDYSKDLASGWSEAKVKGTFTPVNVQNYNLVSFTLKYPSSMDTIRTKFFMSDTTGKTEVLNAEGSFRTKTVKVLGDGWSTVTIRASFKPQDVEVDNLTIGIVGPYADLKNVYIDNVIIGQLDASEDYVQITEAVKTETDTADLTGMATEVKLVDGKATDATKALAAYLKGLQASNQVLFGHQNSTFRSVNDNGATSDVKDVTGSEAGLFGIDTLALAGMETGETTRAEALSASVQASKKAYNGGSIISLSCHMPNFTNSKIKATGDEDYPYDFTKCDFGESKDLTPCADYILEGGEYNPQFNAYLDIIADYALELQKDDIPVLFRPFHENSGGWFWWGTSTSTESYQAMWRYMVNYLDAKGVHNFLYVYSPNGPISNGTEYLERYPGDAYVDVLGFDYYDDYADASVYTGDTFFAALAESCDVVAALADERGKIPAIAESGIRITGAGKDSLMVTGNPTTGRDWYNKLLTTASEHDIPYFLLWANFDSANFFVPYKYNDTLGHEMINEFISFYNNEKSIFGNGTNFYSTGDSGNSTAAVSKADSITLSGYSESVTGYMIAPKNYAVIKDPCDLKAFVKNAKSVAFVVSAGGEAAPVTVNAVKAADSNMYTAGLTQDILAGLGMTSTGSITLVADGVELGCAKFISFNKDADVMPQHVFDNFEYYYGNDGLLQSKYGSHNSASGCSSSFTLNSDSKVEGDYSGVFSYKLTYKGSEVWTGGLGRVFDKDKTDFSAYNAISMWVKPDGNGQKLVMQLNDNYEVYLTDFVKGTEAQYITVPFTSFVKKGGTETIDKSAISGFRIWCNSIPENYAGEKDADGNYTVSGTILFDDIRAVKISQEDLQKVGKDGFIRSDAPLKDLAGSDEDPVQPVNPVQPEDPVQPVNPVQPEDPAQPEDPVQPEAPDIQVSKATTTSITLKWKKNKDAKGYYVYIYNKSKKKYVKVADTKACKATVKKVSGKKLTSGTEYKFKVVAYKLVKGKKTTIKGSALIIRTATKPKTVVILTVRKGAKSAILNWKKVKGASGYQIYMKTGTKGKYKLVQTIKKGKITSFMKTKLKKKTKYTFKIRAYKTVAGKRIYGGYSKAKSVTLK